MENKTELYENKGFSIDFNSVLLFELVYYPVGSGEEEVEKSCPAKNRAGFQSSGRI